MGDQPLSVRSCPYWSVGVPWHVTSVILSHCMYASQGRRPNKHSELLHIPLAQRFSTGVPQEFLKHAIPNYLVRGMDLFSFRWSKKEGMTANIK